MEFFEEIQKQDLNGDSIQSLLTIARLPELCDSITSVVSDDIDCGVIYCVWGEHTVCRQNIRNGVRFTMPDCPNAFTWSVSAKEEDGANKVVIHCTTDTREHDEDFVESLEMFASDWRSGLEKI